MWSRMRRSTARSASLTGREVGFGGHYQVTGEVPRSGDRVCGVGECERELQVGVVGAGGRLLGRVGGGRHSSHATVRYMARYERGAERIQR